MSPNQRIPLLLTIMALTSASLAAPTQPQPTPQLEDLQCRCLTFSTSRTPTPCSYQELLTLDWETAFSLSITNALPIQFASQTTMDTLLAIPKPLPLNLLQSMHEGGEVSPLDPSSGVTSENRVVCGFGQEVDGVSGRGRGGVEQEVHYVGTVLGLFMLATMVWVAGEWVWMRFFSRTGAIMLEGDEKALRAEFDALTAEVKALTAEVRAETKRLPTDYS
ncbi:uncharacterized protein J4E79_000879 [Alternaria viburni]|uniref:uncharacterized protein n=1 Tax=Alternaria viburni TaxID=566460 RepID=UPI0020C2BE51|nr:uncharacterized protein J4E79_000879 [Alternaria viburni]KAI4670593.1 hypothetical protein J4E79_000879 [Alternaria viburni]